MKFLNKMCTNISFIIVMVVCRWLRACVCALMRAVFAVSGFTGVRVRGVSQARSRDAPVLCVAPHSSFFDSIMLVYLGAPSVVAKADTARMPIFGRMHFICFVVSIACFFSFFFVA